MKHNDHTITSVTKCPKAMTRLLRHDYSVHREIDGAVQYNDIIEECRKKKLDGASQWLLEDWMSTLTKRGGVKKRFQYCVNPNSSNQFLYLRAIQGHSEDNAIDSAWQDNVLLPKGFIPRRERECIEFHDKKWINPGGKSFKRGRQAVFFTTVNPMDDGYGMVETPRDLTKPRIAP